MFAEVEKVFVRFRVENLKQFFLHTHRLRCVALTQFGIALEECCKIAVHLARMFIIGGHAFTSYQGGVHFGEFGLGAVEKSGKRQQRCHVHACFVLFVF